MKLINKIEDILEASKKEKLFLPNDLYGYTRPDENDNWFLKELDRYRRHDHGGGPDGDDWLDYHEIDQDFQEGSKKYKRRLDDANKTLKKFGFIPNAEFNLGEKGHFYIEINLERDPKAFSPAKVFNNANRKKFGQSAVLKNHIKDVSGEYYEIGWLWKVERFPDSDSYREIRLTMDIGANIFDADGPTRNQIMVSDDINDYDGISSDETLYRMELSHKDLQGFNQKKFDDMIKSMGQFINKNKDDKTGKNWVKGLKKLGFEET